MKAKWILMLIFVLALSGGTVAMAHGTSSSNGKSSNSMAGMDMNGKDKNMDMSGSKKDDNMAGMDMGEKPIKETPPNMKILGTYGAVNLIFILIGIWNKWFRRKGGAYVNAK